MRRGSECHPRTMKRRKNKWANTLTIGASTIWHGQSTNLLTVSRAKNHKEDQKKYRNKANSAVVASVATTTISTRYAALLATLANLDEEE